jgi:eukaryotic-like serine/threonine-protein kinase
MSSVWLADDPELARRVAVKILAPTADRARFRREARAVAAVSHPNICALFDYGESEGRPFMVLEYLPGGSLEELLARGPLPDEEVARIAREIAAGLEHAHERGLVHRDLKPANVLFDAEGRAKIADFGIVRMGGTGTLTEAGTVLGTAAYISPEQATGLPATAASDVYSFGVMLFRMLTGRLPFVADNAMELARLNRDEPAPAVTAVRSASPEPLARTADAALAKDPGLRPADGAALVAALTGQAAAAVPAPAGTDAAATQLLRVPMQRRRSPPSPRRPSPLLLSALLLALVLLGGGAALALALANRGSGGAGPTGSVPSLSVPSAPSSSPATTPPATTPVVTTLATTARPTTAPATTAPATTTPPPTSTAAATATSATTTAPETTTSPTTTFATTTAPTTAGTATVTSTTP